MIEKPSIAATVLPPLLLLWPASTTHGPALFLAGALFLLVGLVCVIRLGWLFVHPDRPWVLMRRPALALAICVGAAVYTEMSLEPARAFAAATASALERECAAPNGYPAVPAGWTPRGDAIDAETRVGDRVKWPLHYLTDGRSFEIVLYKGPDIGERWSGGPARCGSGRFPHE